MNNKQISCPRVSLCALRKPASAVLFWEAHSGASFTRMNPVSLKWVYNLPDVIAADVVIITEGEKKADVLNIPCDHWFPITLKRWKRGFSFLQDLAPFTYLAIVENCSIPSIHRH